MGDLTITGQDYTVTGSYVVTARTPMGESIRIVIDPSLRDTATMWRILRKAAAETDTRAAALAARKGKTDQGVT